MTTGHDVADARLHRTAAALRRAGFDVEVFGLGDARLGPAGCAIHVSPRRGKLGRALQALTAPFLARADVLITIDPRRRSRRFSGHSGGPSGWRTYMRTTHRCSGTAPGFPDRC
ncbi:hypothetical protein G7085_12485 [Tessaracoccus sp. HDW20]|uniref:hypothetical protein n=1 Tax=Tessaracoccus coleopterorum TaxID=2714950 RepID=UPI0018D337BF|nr:hypothetical protein [Tessaracoccus coleopterorum]NHB85162.1 hypothetical protein [Tessaracoccus coleopterorum]